MTLWVTVSVALVALGTTFGLVFLAARRIDNYGIVDIAWSYAFAGLALFYAVAGAGWGWRRGWLAGMVGIWSLRLGTHLHRRVMAHHPVEDGRYVELRREWSGRLGPAMFRFFQLQAVSVVLLGFPFLLPMQNAAPHLAGLEMVGTTFWLAGIAGEALADAQLAAFKRRAADNRGVCRTGLWRYSRHPNYFFEWLVWVGYFVFAAATPGGWVTVYAPLLMLALLFRVTGIPLTEQQSIRSKGDAYRAYQATTSAFVPWFQKKPPA